MSSAISATTAPTNSSELFTSGVVPGSNGTLGQNDFLKLLVAQIQFQDPLNPKSNTDMAAQMAQFTSLSQASATTSSLAMIQANSLIGSSVTVQLESNKSTTGVVSGVTLINGQPKILIDGKNYSLSQVTAVRPVSLAAAATGTTGTATATDTVSAPVSEGTPPTETTYSLPE